MSLPPFKLGVMLVVDDDSPGSQVVDVFPGTLAARIKMREGDIIFRVNGKPIETREDVEAFLAESNAVAEIIFWQEARNKYRRVRIVQTYAYGTSESMLNVTDDEEMDSL